MHSTLIQLGISAVMWLIAIATLVLGKLMYGSWMHWGMAVLIFAMVAWFVKPSTETVDAMCDALRDEVKRRESQS